MNQLVMQNLLDRYLSGACTDEEQAIVENWLEQQDQEDNAWTKMDAPARATWMAGLRQDLQHAIRKDAGRPGIAAATLTPFYRRPFFRVAAAAAVLILAGAGLWWRMQGSPVPAEQGRESQRLAADVLPGGNKALLTLANGSTITLDSAANGELAQQGNTTILKTAGGQLAYNTGNTPVAEIFYNTLVTPRGGQYQLTLPDGSKVWLNAASSIRYPTLFAGKERKVEVRGEAYFEVTENAAMPFIVTIAGPSGKREEIKVLGTQFNVNAYEDEALLRTSLLRGAVRVGEGAAILVLRPGQQAQLDRTGTLRLAEDADMEEAIAWKNGNFSCKNMELGDMMRQVARWYDVEVVFEASITDRYTVSVPRNLPLSNLFRFLEESGGVHFKIEGKKITVLK